MNSSTLATENTRTEKRNKVQSRHAHTKELNGRSIVVTDLLRDASLLMCYHKLQHESCDLPFVARSRRENHQFGLTVTYVDRKCANPVPGVGSRYHPDGNVSRLVYNVLEETSDFSFLHSSPQLALRVRVVKVTVQCL